MRIQYIIGDATDPPHTSPAVIVHVCNYIGAWGRGFVLALSKRWKEPERQYRAWARGDISAEFKLGAVQFVQVETAPALWVANIIGQHGIKRQGGAPPVRYDAIQRGLATVGAFAAENNAAVHMPRIGCGLAGGAWDRIEPIIETELLGRGVEVFVYDLPK